MLAKSRAMLTRFWFEFEFVSDPSFVNYGCGVTAYTYDDALSILQKRVFAGRTLPKVRRLVPNGLLEAIP